MRALLGLIIFAITATAGAKSLEYPVHGRRGDSGRYWDPQKVSFTTPGRRKVTIQTRVEPGHNRWNILDARVNCGRNKIKTIFQRKRFCGLPYVEYKNGGETLIFHFTEYNSGSVEGDCSGRESTESISLQSLCAATPVATPPPSSLTNPDSASDTEAPAALPEAPVVD